MQVTSVGSRSQPDAGWLTARYILYIFRIWAKNIKFLSLMALYVGENVTIKGSVSPNKSSLKVVLLILIFRQF